MTRKTRLTGLGRATVALAALALGACGAGERIANIGRPPPLSPIVSPTESPGYEPVRMPMPAPRVAENQPNSLWQSGSRAFFRDQRAGDVGDILTILIEIDDSARLDNSSGRSRGSNEDATLPYFLGFEQRLDRWLPDGVDNENLTEFGADSSFQGQGSTQRQEAIELMVAATIVQILPNGNMVVYGRQEIRVNFEARDLEIAGIIRPEDISSQNTVNYEQIAEARISYGGRGQITDYQQPRYGQQLYDIVFPF
ncbi:MAG: flagellar basal body L-ring protein FlgH [Rhodospirillaceae bacterium]|nr:flagellar basal body L-ring protein FlgH [Rhodospirillaceae bacterium]